MFGLPSSLLVGNEQGDGKRYHEPSGAGNTGADKEKWCALLPAPHGLADIAS